MLVVFQVFVEASFKSSRRHIRITYYDKILGCDFTFRASRIYHKFRFAINFELRAKNSWIFCYIFVAFTNFLIVESLPVHFIIYNFISKFWVKECGKTPILIRLICITHHFADFCECLCVCLNAIFDVNICCSKHIIVDF